MRALGLLWDGMLSLIAFCLVTLHLAGCSQSSRVAQSPRLILEDSTVLSETDSAYVGRPGGLYVDSQRSMYVPDLLSDRVFRYDSAGRLDRLIGRAGSGPGEFRGVGDILLEWKGLVAIQSYGHRRLSFFDTESGTPRAEVPYSGTLTSGTRSEDTAWFGSLDFKSGYGVMRLDLSSVSRTVGRLPISSSVAPLPSIYRSNEAVRGTYGLVQVAAWPNRLLVGYAAESTLVLYRSDGTTLDTLFIPTLQRRGHPPDFARRMDLGRSAFSEIVGMASALFGILPQPSGDFVLVYLDSRLEGKRSIRSKAFISLLSANLRQVCLDAPVPFAGDGQPRIALDSDKLAVLDQHAISGSRVQTVVRRYRIDVSACRWVPTHKEE